jgi:hypothetical protein
MQVTGRSTFRSNAQPGKSQEVIRQGGMATVGSHGPEQNVPIATSDDGEIRARLKLVPGPHPLRDYELPFNRERCCHQVRLSYNPGDVNRTAKPPRTQGASPGMRHPPSHFRLVPAPPNRNG